VCENHCVGVGPLPGEGRSVEESFSRACREESFSRIVVSSEETKKGRLINIYILINHNLNKTSHKA
jgi:hypothetical protein